MASPLISKTQTSNASCPKSSPQVIHILGIPSPQPRGTNPYVLETIFDYSCITLEAEQNDDRLALCVCVCAQGESGIFPVTANWLVHSGNSK